MNFLTFNTVRRKLLAVVMLTTLVALVVALGAIVGYNLRSYHYNLISDMATQSELLGHMTAPALTFDDQKLARENLNLLRLRPKIRAAAIYDASGHLFSVYSTEHESEPFPASPLADSEYVEGRNMIVFKRIVNDGEVLGAIYLRADYEFVDRLLAHLGIAIIVIAIAMLVAFVFSMRLQRVISEPISAIAGIAREVVEQQDYSRRAQKTSTDEVGVLVDSFNDMMAEIQRRTEALERSNDEIAREVNERRVIQQEVMRLNLELEERVLERTAQLEAANVALEAAKSVAEKANQAKSAFLSSMSHELRTPLNAILGFTQLFLVQPEALTPEKIEIFSTQILKAGEHLLVLINEILDLAKIEAGAVTLSMEPVSVSEVLSECQELIGPMAQQRGIRLDFSLRDCPHVFADRTRLKQVLLNLLSNAIKYNRDAGTVEVRFAEGQTGYVRIAVRDTGAGLNDMQLQQLFQPFNRLGQEIGVQEGTGIGLVVTKRLLELMGGRIGVVSKVGSGSEFWIELQRPGNGAYAGTPAAMPAVTKAERDASHEGLHTVLYVEDNPVNLKLVQEVIAFRSDIRLLTAADGRLGMALAEAHQPDVILLDINLPGINGNQVLTMLQADARTRSIPVIAVTANAMPKDIERGLAQGFFRYLTKPINVSELLSVLDEAIVLAEARRAEGDKN